MQYKQESIIKISSLQNLGNLILSPVLNKFMQQHRNIKFLITIEGHLDLLRILEYYDVVFHSGKLFDSPIITSKLFFEHDYVVCGSPIYFSRKEIPKKLDDLDQHNCVDCRYGGEGEHTWTFFEGKEQYDIAVKSDIITNNALLVKHLALNHIALVYAPTFIVADDINEGRLIPVLTRFKTRKKPIFIVYPYTSKDIPQKTVIFIEFVLSYAQIPAIKKDIYKKYWVAKK